MWQRQATDRQCGTIDAALQMTHLSGLARLDAPAVRSTDRMLRRPKS